jgi:hypothetical protein
VELDNSVSLPPLKKGATSVERVTHELKVFEELPPRRTLLNEQLTTIARNPAWYGKPVQIGSYAKASAANGAKHLLQNRWGKTAEEHGWTFVTRQLMEDDEYRTGLFAIFTPEAARHKAKSNNGHEPEVETKPEVIDLSEPKPEAQAQPEPVPVEQQDALSRFTPQQLERLARIKNLDEILEALGG